LVSKEEANLEVVKGEKSITEYLTIMEREEYKNLYLFGQF
jgi:hypothetical protein